MGNEPLQPQQVLPNDVPSNYVLVSQSFDRRYGLVQVLHETTTNQLVWACSKLIYSREDRVLRSAKAVTKWPSIPIQRVSGIFLHEDDVPLQCGGQQYTATVLFEHCSLDLEQLIQTHIRQSFFFSDEELFTLYETLLEALSFLQEQQITFNEITPSTILITSTRTFKLCNPLFLVLAVGDRRDDVIQDGESIKRRTVYVSPEGYQFRKDDANESKPIDPFKSAVFSLGMLLLEVASLERLDEVYDEVRRVINKNTLDRFLTDISKNYSTTLIKTIKLLLEFDPSKRPDFKDLKQRSISRFTSKALPQAAAFLLPHMEPTNSSFSSPILKDGGSYRPKPSTSPIIPSNAFMLGDLDNEKNRNTNTPAKGNEKTSISQPNNAPTSETKAALIEEQINTLLMKTGETYSRFQQRSSHATPSTGKIT